MDNPLFFFDTYAFMEVINGNPNYEKYKEVEVITSIFNLAELNYALKKEKLKEEADKITERYNPLLVDVAIKDIKDAMDLKIKNKQLSIPDVIGYILARKFNAKFLTGDSAFQNMENVEFVK